MVLAGATWLAGALWLVVLRRRWQLALPDAFAYPLGLLLLIVVSTAFLVHVLLGVLGLALALAPAVRVRRPGLAVARAAVATAWAAPAIVGLGALLGFFLHGPTRDVDSNAFGDVVWYVAKLESARESLFPLRDLAAAGLDLWHAELAPSLVGAAASPAPGF